MLFQRDHISKRSIVERVGITRIIVCFFAIYVLIIIGLTIVFRKKEIIENYELSLFWSYREWIKGNSDLGKEIILNIGLFIPYSFMLMNILGDKSKKKAAVIVSGFLLSIVIESIQFCYKIGLAEFDDIFNNTLGTVIGVYLYYLCDRISKRGSFAVSFIFVIMGAILSVGQAKKQNELQAPLFAFSIDRIEDGKIYGYAFPFNIDAGKVDYDIVLREASTGDKVKLDTVCGYERNDVNMYYDSQYNYTNSGFVAVVEKSISNAEILVDWDGVGLKETGMFLVDGKCQGANGFIFDFLNTDLVNLFENGFLLANNMENHCLIYQVDNKLYWVVDDEFYFEDDKSTYIQYQLWTSNVDKLPENRIQYGFDNKGFVFEDYEITDTLNSGSYRVSCMEIPEEYPVTYIKTGYYDHNEWIWYVFFEPIWRNN